MNFEKYSDCAEFLFSLERTGIKYDLKNITALLKYLDNPQKHFKTIHIAGTNGKGSVASILNSILIEAGFKTGLYTSPHLTDLRERFLVNGKYISKKFILDFTGRMYDKIMMIKPSFFEAATALAFEYFKVSRVDYAVIETGLGGRLDSTNIVKPVLSVITGLGIEHTEYLGNTIESITKEKGGIIKNGVPVVAGKMPAVSRKILRQISEEKKSEIVFTDKVSGCRITRRDAKGFIFDYSDKVRKLAKARFPVIGDFQCRNIQTAITSLNMLPEPDFGKNSIVKGLKNIKQNSKLHGRFEIVNKDPFTIVDVSHNEQGIKNLKRNLEYVSYNSLYVIFGMMEDKDYKKSINEIEKLGGEVIITRPDYKRAADPEKIFQAAVKRDSITIKENVKESYKYARGKMKRKDLLLITGSFYVAGEFLKIINED